MPESKKTYIGSECFRGHKGERYVKSRACVECYKFKYEQRKEQVLQKLKDKRLNDPEWRARFDAKSSARNKGKKRPYTDERREYHRAYNQNNKPRKKAIAAKRRMLKNQDTPSFTNRDVEYILSYQCYLCANPLCGCDLVDEGYHLDHYFPLSKGGSNCASNIQALCPRCNLCKATMDWQTFLEVYEKRLLTAMK